MKLLYCLFLLLPIKVFSYGSLFYGNSYPIEKRTKYEVFAQNNKPFFEEEILISFDLQIKELNTFGYIFSLEDQYNNTLNFTFSYKDGSNSVFHISINQKYNASLDFFNDSILNNWIPVNFIMNLNKGDVEACIGGKKVYLDSDISIKRLKPNMYFGKYGFIVDMPTFALKNLEIKDHNNSFYFHLNESEGGVVHEKTNKGFGKIENNKWLINDSYFWKEIFRRNIKGSCGVNIDDKYIYILSKDTFVSCNLNTYEVNNYKYENDIPISILLGTSFFDNIKRKIYLYELNGLPLGNTTFASFDLKSRKWERENSLSLPVQLHQHNSFFDVDRNRLIIFGGFGNKLYNNSFVVFDLNNNIVDTLNLKNNIIDPRFFSGMTNVGDSILYIYGGCGNSSGKQYIGKKYYDDLYKINLKTNKIEDSLSFNLKEFEVVGNNMVYSYLDHSIYLMKYKEYNNNTTAQLYKLSINDKDIYPLGNTIPFLSISIKTTLSLFLNKKYNKLYCIIKEYFNDDKELNVIVYELGFPPVSIDKVQSDSDLDYYIDLIIIVFIIVLFIFVLLKYRKKNFFLKDIVKHNVINNNSHVQVLPQYVNSIFLFGNFTVYNSVGRDITYMFSAKLKYMFIYILVSGKDGVLSNNLNTLFWPDKDEKKAKNLKGVTINHLRKVLLELDGVSLRYNKGYFNIEIGKSCFCDYINVHKCICENNYHEIVSIIDRGKFLCKINEDIFDNVKGSLESSILDFLDKILSSESLTFGEMIRICNCILLIDSINETAFLKLIKNYAKAGDRNKSLEVYYTYIKEYKAMMGNDYSYSYDELLKM